MVDFIALETIFNVNYETINLYVGPDNREA